MQSKQASARFFTKQLDEPLFDTLNFSINLMWINANRDLESEFICSGQSLEGMQYTLNQLRKWRVANPQAAINFWYDSQCTNPKAIHNTKKCIDEISQETGSVVSMRDIREIPFVQNNSDIFQATLAVYFRVDYLKLIICLYLMEDEGQDSVTYTDLSICDKVDTALSKLELYNPQVLINLKKWGMLTGKDPIKPENQFFQTLNTPVLIESLKHAINCSLYLSVNALNYAHQLQNANISNHINNVTFVTMVYVYIYFIALNSGESIQIRADVVNQGNSDVWTTYSPEEHGYCMFGNFPKTFGLGTIQLNFTTKEITRLNDIVKLPENLKLKPNITGIMDLGEVLGDSFIEQTVRTDLNPGRIGGDHAWYGPLPVPTHNNGFRCSYWAVKSVRPVLEPNPSQGGF